MALELINYPKWWNEGNGRKIVDIVAQCLLYNERMTSERTDTILNVTKKRIEAFEKSIRKKKI